MGSGTEIIGTRQKPSEGKYFARTHTNRGQANHDARRQHNNRLEEEGIARLSAPAKFLDSVIKTKDLLKVEKNSAGKEISNPIGELGDKLVLALGRSQSKQVDYNPRTNISAEYYDLEPLKAAMKSVEDFMTEFYSSQPLKSQMSRKSIDPELKDRIFKRFTMLMNSLEETMALREFAPFKLEDYRKDIEKLSGRAENLRIEFERNIFGNKAAELLEAGFNRKYSVQKNLKPRQHGASRNVSVIELTSNQQKASDAPKRPNLEKIAKFICEILDRAYENKISNKGAIRRLRCLRGEIANQIKLADMYVRAKTNNDKLTRIEPDDFYKANVKALFALGFKYLAPEGLAQRSHIVNALGEDKTVREFSAKKPSVINAETHHDEAFIRVRQAAEKLRAKQSAGSSASAI